MKQTLQQFIIEDLNVAPVITPATEIKTRVNILKDILKNSKRKGFTMSVSAEQGSALSAHIAQTAIKELRAETGDLRYHFIALYLPEGQPSAKEANESAIIIRNFIKADEIIGHDITPNLAEKTAKHPELTNDKGQMKTRVRTAIAHGYAKPRNYMVVGAGNSAENVLGEATLLGDTIAHVQPLRGLTRHQVNQMLHHLNAPAFLLAKIPTVSEAGVDFNNVDKYLSGKNVESGMARRIEQSFLTTEDKRHKHAGTFFTKFEQHKTENESRLLATA